MNNFAMNTVFFTILFYFIQIVFTENCGNGEKYSYNFQKCCDDTHCSKGYFFNCTECRSCSKGRYQDKVNQDPDCKLHTSCSDDEYESFVGNSTHDKVCSKKLYIYTVVGVTTTMNIHPGDSQVSDVNTTTNTHPGNSQDEFHHSIGLIVGGILVFWIFVILLYIFYRYSYYCVNRYNKRKKRRDEGLCSNTYQNVENGHLNNNELEHVELLVNGNDYPSNDSENKDSFIKAQKNISRNMTKLRRDMVSDGGLFWAALKEGSNSAYSYNEHRGFLLRDSADRNGKLLDKAVLSRGNLRSLIYALKVSEQSHLIGNITNDLDADIPSDRSWIPGDSPYENLKNNRVYILRNLTVDNNFWSYLRQGNVYTEEDEEVCQKMIENSAKDYLIETLLRGDEKKMTNFGEALWNTGNEHLYKYIFEYTSVEETTKKNKPLEPDGLLSDNASSQKSISLSSLK